MRIIVDADACPGRKIIEKAAIENSIEVIMYCDINHALISDYSTIKVVDSGFQSVDMKIINEVKKDDIVVTQDYGVAAMVLGRKAYAIDPKGYIYDNDNIERLLFERHLSAKARRGGKKTLNPKKRTIEDDDRLYKNILKLIGKANKL
ncbi:YaiI/YqxD family protein [Clostridium botulinum D/C]|uniref:YaiI/YqxD family protein n=1 Tax=Clostridium botulinum TaxID=1491 RepID=UPI001E630002|nr:YaiI/YqxD family protein [Clostridium botulinum]MCD3351305.1 YaiI/YqxD family protein [Clostridium botulinum D/C]MCD3360262.1 YaiI/YqxD family protein [Clostridium botulinum D/C]MCD3362777.1 YaiI/YqxD family protein [Clostridium botulinum D/C]MCD3366096.1 YaiI/YqxD family protein [Clostridium botulinum D/C]